MGKDSTANLLLICGSHRQTDNRLQISESILPGVTQHNAGGIKKKKKTVLQALLLASPHFQPHKDSLVTDFAPVKN